MYSLEKCLLMPSAHFVIMFLGVALKFFFIYILYSILYQILFANIFFLVCCLFILLMVSLTSQKPYNFMQSHLLKFSFFLFFFFFFFFFFFLLLPEEIEHPTYCEDRYQRVYLCLCFLSDVMISDLSFKSLINSEFLLHSHIVSESGPVSFFYIQRRILQT